VSAGGQFPGEGDTFDHCQIIYEYASGVRGFLGLRCQDGCHKENADYIIGADGVCTRWKRSGTSHHRGESVDLQRKTRAHAPEGA